MCNRCVEIWTRFRVQTAFITVIIDCGLSIYVDVVIVVGFVVAVAVPCMDVCMLVTVCGCVSSLVKMEYLITSLKIHTEFYFLCYSIFLFFFQFLYINWFFFLLILFFFQQFSKTKNKTFLFVSNFSILWNFHLCLWSPSSPNRFQAGRKRKHCSYN